MTSVDENTTVAQLLAYDDREQHLQLMQLHTSIHHKHNHVCIHKSPTSPGYNISTPTAKNIVEKALTSYKHCLRLERERIEARRHAERAIAADEAVRDAAVRLKANR